MTENQKLREAFEQGWKMAAEWALSDHLLADMESPAYLKERDCRLQALALPTDPLTRYRVWPDGTVQEGSESPYAWKSDDFAYVDAVTEEQAHETLKIKELLAANATKMIETADQQPAATESVAWNSIQTASWIGTQLMHQPSMFERAAVCKFVRSLGRHPTLLKHSPKTHPVPSVPADVVRDAARYRWLADCNNYPEAVTLVSDGSLTADALGKAIDAVMRKDEL